MVQVDLVTEAGAACATPASRTRRNQRARSAPATTAACAVDAEQRGRKVVNANPAVASSLAKGARALGVAVATGEIRAASSRTASSTSKSLFRLVASTSAGGEQVACRVLVIGNIEGAP